MAETTVRADRLLKLADHLDTVPPERFDIQVFYERRKCGSVACALGHACLIPQFRRAGFHLDRVFGYPVFGIWTSMNAGAEFFGIDRADAMDLFDTCGYDENPTPREVAARIRAFVHGKTDAHAAAVAARGE